MLTNIPYVSSRVVYILKKSVNVLCKTLSVWRENIHCVFGWRRVTNLENIGCFPSSSKDHRIVEIEFQYPLLVHDFSCPTYRNRPLMWQRNIIVMEREQEGKSSLAWPLAKISALRSDETTHSHLIRLEKPISFCRESAWAMGWVGHFSDNTAIWFVVFL